MGFIKIFSSVHIMYFNHSYSSPFPSLVTLLSSSKQQASLLLHGVCVCERESRRETKWVSLCCLHEHKHLTSPSAISTMNCTWMLRERCSPRNPSFHDRALTGSTTATVNTREYRSYHAGSVLNTVASPHLPLALLFFPWCFLWFWGDEVDVPFIIEHPQVTCPQYFAQLWISIVTDGYLRKQKLLWPKPTSVLMRWLAFV